MIRDHIHIQPCHTNVLLHSYISFPLSDQPLHLAAPSQNSFLYENGKNIFVQKVYHYFDHSGKEVWAASHQI